MNISIYRYATLLLTGSLLIGTTLPQASVSATSLEAMRVQTVSQTQSSNRLQLQNHLQSQNSGLPSDRTAQSLPKIVARRVKQEISRSFNVPVGKLRVTAAQARTWNGCLGLPDPLALCTTIAIPGWQVIVTAGQRSWVYHTTQNGSQVRLNEAASLTQGSEITPSFLPEDQSAPITDDSIVFQTVTQGGIAARTVITRLTAEGLVTQQTIAPNIRSHPIILKRITPEQVTTFLQQVEQQKFNHLNRLRYQSDRGADLTTTQMSTRNAVTEFTDTDSKQLSLALQNISNAWQTLLRS
jgi:hypothetical protein